MFKRSRRYGRIRPSTFAIAAAMIAVPLAATQLASTRADAPAEVAAPAATPVTVAHPLVKPVSEWDEHSGQFRAIESVEVRARVSGYLEDIGFEDGQIVKKGDLLFRIDQRPFQAELDAAKADLTSADAVLANAKAEYERGQRLLEREALSREEADRRGRALRQADAAVAAAKARVDQAALNLEFTEVRAPITGRISDNFVSEGNLIAGGSQGGTLLTTVVSLDPIYFEFTASEADYLKYVRGAGDANGVDMRDNPKPVFGKLMDEDNYVHEGRLTFLDNQLDPSTGTMRGRATFPNPDGVLAPGMYGRLKLQHATNAAGVLIPDTAVQTDQNEKFVWVAAGNNTAERRVVELGPVIEGMRLVRTGLDGDDRLIVGGSQFLFASAPVEPEFATSEDNQQLAAIGR
ncbi:efflux RND transporter periplasmic adaptor subunit [Gimibacter soli]|uniref:Efflux RND transporter periplasmic adaptor subunit n=1 Tax=Gimibacter soli TaxID=3024400 RepID=A0AAE9XW38_9PROT|nr:efflux RND transporter periplasmic adaptor subunit [Gimibacter soli]WCL55278.1 efflux RND transporter periplasmic adaptor subunit [Gimibacter soli]